MKHYVIGLGTGRCGTKSLAKLLNDCKKVNVSHEFRKRNRPYVLSWELDEVEAQKRVIAFNSFRGNLVGDIASYYLNYVEYFIQHLENVKFLYLYRKPSEVVESFMKKSFKYCHWLSPDHAGFKKGRYQRIKWDITFPKFNEAKTKREAIQKYLLYYEQRMSQLILKYPERFLVIPIESLNDFPFQKKLFDFLEVPEENRFRQLVMENRSPQINKGS